MVAVERLALHWCGLYSRPSAEFFGTRPKAIMDPRLIDDLARRLAGTVPESLTAVRRDLEANFKAVLQAGLAKFDLVTRQEFDVQAGVLRRTREKLEALEARLAAFESNTTKHTAEESHPRTQ